MFPPQFEKIEDTGFKSTALLVEFVQLMQEGLLVPLWQNIRVRKGNAENCDLSSLVVFLE